MTSPAPDVTLDHERVANEAKHWVRLTAACNSRCIFCLDAEAQDGKLLPFDDVCAEIRRGREEHDAARLVISGGEASIHPRFHDAIRYGKSVGYRWVQTVTNGQKLADRRFFLDAMDAGLDEITFSLHGHTAALHDRLTRTKNGFDNLMKAMIRAVRDGRPVVNVDVCINKQNVEHLEAIVALCARVGVREFDLLHVIPQSEAWAHRDELFYDPAQHRDALRKVFRLARAPGFHVWTNRFPLSHLEDLEELIQDPHKMLDEVGGRRRQFRRYLDAGEPLECRDAERCPHCFVEPFCSALDRLVEDGHEARFDVWWVGERLELAYPRPWGTRWLGVSRVPERADAPLYLRAGRYMPDVSLPAGSRAVATHPDHLEQLAGFDGDAEVHLDAAMCRHIASMSHVSPRWILHVPTHATAADAAEDPDWKAFFAALPPGVRAQNAPPCLTPGATVERPLRILDAALFHSDGRLAIDRIVDRHIGDTYRVKSDRCRACPADASCDGAHIQWIRAHGFRHLAPLAADDPAVARLAALFPPRPGLRDGVAPQAPAPRVPAPGNDPVPFVDEAPGRRS